MNKKLMYAAMALPMLFTACSQDELFENTNGGMNTPEAKGFYVTMGPSLDIDSPETRAIWEASAGKLTWEAKKDLISVFWLGNQWGTSALTGQFNSVFSTTDGENFTSESMIYVGNNVSVYPADLAHVTSKAVTLSVPEVQNAETILKTPYISNLLEVSEPKDNREEQEAGYHNKLVSPMKMAANVLVLNLHLDNIENLAQFGFAVKSVSLTADKNAFATTANLKQGGDVTNKEQGRVWEKISPWSSVGVNTINKYLYASATASIPTLTATDITDKGNGDYEVKFVILPTHTGELDLKALSKIVVETNCGRLELTTTQKVGKNAATGIETYPAADQIAEGTTFSGVVTDKAGNKTAIAQLLESVSKHFTAAVNANSTFKGEKIGVPYMRYVTGDMANATLNDSRVYSDTEILNYVAIHKAMNSTEPMNLILCDVVDEEGNGDGIFESLTNDVFNAIESRKISGAYKATMSLDKSVQKLMLQKNGNSAYMYFNNYGQWKNVGQNSLHVVLAAGESAWTLPWRHSYDKIGTIENPVGGSLKIEGSNNYELNEPVLNNGTLNIAGEKLLVGKKLTNNGTVNVAAAQDLVFNADVESGINGTINVVKGAFMTISAGINVTSNATINNAGVVASNAGNGGLVNRGTINNLEGGYSYVQDNTYDAALDNKIVLTNRADEVKVEKAQGKIVYNYDSATDGNVFTRSIEDKFTYVVFGEGNDEIILEDEVIDDISMEFTSETVLKTVGQTIADLTIVKGAHLRFPTPSTDYDNKLYVNDLTIKGDLTIGGIIYYSGNEEGKEKARSVGNGAIIFNAAGAVDNLEAAIAAGGEVSLVADLTLDEALNVEGDVELDMNNKEITGNINVGTGASLTVENGTISNENDAVSGITSNGDLTLNNVEIESTRHALRIESGNVTINGGIYKTAVGAHKYTQYALNIGDSGTEANVTINGGEFIGPKGTGADSGSAVIVKVGSKVVINNGTFHGGLNSTLSVAGEMTIYGGKFDQDPSAYVADGYQAVKDGDWWIVSAE